MSDTVATTAARVGDCFEVNGLPGRPTKRGQIVEVLGAGEHVHFPVRWDEQHESLLYPTEGATIVHRAATRDAARGKTDDEDQRRRVMTSEGSPRAIVLTRVKAIVEFLDGQGVAYELVEHESAMSSPGEARVAHLPTDQVAKTVLLLDGSGYVIATVSASARLDLRKVRELLGATRNLRLATEDEIARDFPTLEVGAVPPFGPWVPAAEVIDSALLEKERILCPAGDHRHSVLIDPREVVRVTAARTAAICED